MEYTGRGELMEGTSSGGDQASPTDLQLVETACRSAASEIAHIVAEAKEAFEGSPLQGGSGELINRFSDPVWDLKHLLSPVRASGNRRLYFTQEGSLKEPLPEFVADAFRAFIIHKYQTVKTVTGMANILLVLRKLWSVMWNRRPVLTEQHSEQFRWVTVCHADLTALEKHLHDEIGIRGHIRDAMMPAVEFVAFLQTPHRAVVPKWVYRPPRGLRSRHRMGTPEERAEWRRRSLPHTEAVVALANYYWQTKPKGPIDRSDRELLEDRVMICLTVIFLCGGFRVTEGATLPADCFDSVFEEGEIRCFLRYGNLKSRQRGEAPRVRWVSPAQARLVRDALRELFEITEPWRELARDLEGDPDRVVIRDEDGNARDDDQLVGRDEATRLLGLQGNLATFRPSLVPVVPARGAIGARYRIGDIAAAVQQDREQWGLTTSVRRRRGRKADQKLSESLLVVPVHFLARSSDHHPLLVEPLSPQKIAGWLSGAARYRTIFTKISSVPEQTLRLRTHQFRHLLNYCARKRGMTDALITIWMGRADPRQTASYTHDAPTDVAAATMRERILRGELDGRKVDHLLGLPSDVRESVLEAEVQAAHDTSIGECTANFRYDPCPYFGSCLRKCWHFMVERGNQGQLVQITGMRRRNEAQRRLFDERAAAGEDLEPGQRERIVEVIEGCRDAERRIQSGPPDGLLVQVFPEGEDRFVPFDADGR